MAKKQSIPGIVRPVAAFRSTDRKSQPKTIEEKRATVIPRRRATPNGSASAAR